MRALTYARSALYMARGCSSRRLSAGGKLAGERSPSPLAACALFLVFALGPFAFWYLMDVNNYRAQWHGWVASARMESAVHPVSIRNYAPLMTFFFLAAPLILVALPAAIYKEWHARRLSPLLLMGTIGLLANLSLIVHYSVVINNRYLLTGLPALAPLVGDYFLRTETKRLARRIMAPVFDGCWWHRVNNSAARSGDLPSGLANH
ncbi:MAG: hypothetical protein WKF84_01595 [Pyrinomonadaceae bacterium]